MSTVLSVVILEEMHMLVMVTRDTHVCVIGLEACLVYFSYMLRHDFVFVFVFVFVSAPGLAA